MVLATATVPRADAQELGQRLRVSTDEHGFFSEAHPKLRPVESLTAGVFLAGAAQFPKDIPETVAQASGAAAKVLSLFSQRTDGPGANHRLRGSRALLWLRSVHPILSLRCAHDARLAAHRRGQHGPVPGMRGVHHGLSQQGLPGAQPDPPADPVDDGSLSVAAPAVLDKRHAQGRCHGARSDLYRTGERTEPPERAALLLLPALLGRLSVGVRHGLHAGPDPAPGPTGAEGGPAPLLGHLAVHRLRDLRHPLSERDPRRRRHRRPAPDRPGRGGQPARALGVQAARGLSGQHPQLGAAARADR